MSILLTGASGFVGDAFLQSARLQNKIVRPVYRGNNFDKNLTEGIVFDAINQDTDWSEALRGIDVIVHLAGLAHIMKSNSMDLLSEYRRVNVEITLSLARQAARAGVKRFIFLSSVGVNGAITNGTPFFIDDRPAPHSAYSLSKYEAEVGLKNISTEMGIELVIIRAPLIYGRAAPGNFGDLIKWVSRGLPLPLRGVTTNQRSLVALENLLDLLFVCTDHPAAANQTFFVSDGLDISTADMLSQIAKALNCPNRSFRVPHRFLFSILLMIGKQKVAHQLLGSLQVDITHTCRVLNWRPPVSMDEALKLSWSKL